VDHGQESPAVGFRVDGSRVESPRNPDDDRAGYGPKTARYGQRVALTVRAKSVGAISQPMDPWGDRRVHL